MRFYGQRKNISKDSAILEIEQKDNYFVHILMTTASAQKVSIETKYTYNRTYNLLQYEVVEEIIGEGDIRFRFEIKVDEWGNYNANLLRDFYYYDEETSSFIFAYSEGIDGTGLEKENVIFCSQWI